MALKKSSRQLVEEANARIRTLPLSDALQALEAGSAVFVDIRDARELDREGTIPGAFHAPRGMLEFWVDPDSPYFKEALAPDREMILFCQSSWRSALAAVTLLDMGVASVAHIDGGFRAWKEAGNPTVSREENRLISQRS